MLAQPDSNKPAFRAAELAALLARHYPDANPYRIARVVAAMQTAARASVNWQVRRCNEAMTEAQEERGERRIARMADKINHELSLSGLGRTAAGAGTNAELSLGGDPRGPCARLTIPGQRGDGWGDGFAVY